MLIAAVVLAILAGLLHVWIFVMESVLFDRPSIHARFAVRSQDVPVVRPWAYNQGFYNLFLGIGALVGVIVAASGHHGVGLAIRHLRALHDHVVDKLTPPGRAIADLHDSSERVASGTDAGDQIAALARWQGGCRLRVARCGERERKHRQAA